MPVLYVAVGRRLGYPLKLATTKGHLFARWDGLDHSYPAWRERFNIEGTHGFSSYPDDYYKTWPFKLTDPAKSKPTATSYRSRRPKSSPSSWRPAATAPWKTARRAL